MKQILALLVLLPLQTFADTGFLYLAHTPASTAGCSASIALEYTDKTARIRHSWNDVSRREFEEDGVLLSGLSGDSFQETLFQFRHYGVARKNGIDGEATSLTLFTSPDHSEALYVDFQGSAGRLHGYGKAWKSLKNDLPGSYDATPRAEFVIEEFQRALYFIAEE